MFNRKKIIKRDISYENITAFTFLLEKTKWEKTLPIHSPYKTYEIFHFIFEELCDTTFPK